MSNDVVNTRTEAPSVPAQATGDKSDIRQVGTYQRAMTEFTEPTPHNHGINYAFMLALTAYLAEVETRLLSQPADANLSLEQTLWAQDMTTNFRLVQEFGFQRLADYYMKQDIATNCPQGQFKLSFSYTMETRLLGPRVEAVNLVTTEQILTKIDEPAPFTGVLLYTNQLREKLYVILQNAAKILATQAENAPSVAHIISATTSELLSSLREHKNLWEELQLHALELQLDATAAFLRKESSVLIKADKLFNIFKILLESQLQVGDITAGQETTVKLSVYMLRELGNNLMENSSFPQAIKVYSEAIYTCDYTCSNNIPQLFTNRAIAFIGLNCFSEATLDLNMAVRYDRSFTPAWAQLGYCHLYQGSGFLALKCYFTALRTMAGEIYPENFPENKELKEDYTLNKMKSIMPQFVQRLVQSIILTEKRAEQQRESTQAIQEITTKVRAILARLRSVVDASSLPYLLYSHENEAENVRATAARANRARPNILTPDVAQDLMASANMEASAVTVPPAISVRSRATRQNNNNNRDRNGETTRDAAENRTQSPPLTQSSDNLLGFFNNLGEIFNDAVQNQLDSTNGSPSPIVTPQASLGESRSTTSDIDANVAQSSTANLNPQTDTATTAGVRREQTNVPLSDSDFRNTLRNFVPGLRGNLGGLINQALRHHLQARELTDRNARQLLSEENATGRTSFSPRVVRIDRNGNSEVISNPVRITTPYRRDGPLQSGASNPLESTAEASAMRAMPVQNGVSGSPLIPRNLETTVSDSRSDLDMSDED